MVAIGWAWGKLKEFGVVDFFKKIYTGVRPYIIYIKELITSVSSILQDFMSADFDDAYNNAKNFKMPNLQIIKDKIRVEQIKELEESKKNAKKEEEEGDFAGVKTNDNIPGVSGATPSGTNPGDDARAIKGGSQTKNTTINIGNLAKIDQYNPKAAEINNMSKAEFERWMTEMFLRVARSADRRM
jgi:hypothetical protein